MAYIIEGEKHPVIYCANYRVASSAVRDTILEMGGRKMRPGAQHHDPPEELPKGALIVETVRDHLDVIESMWYFHDLPVHDTPWGEYVEKVLEGKHEYLTAEKMYGRFPTNYILRYETLDFEWKTLCVNAGLEETPLRTTPRTLKGAELWTYKLRKQVHDCYAEEREELGYGIS